MANQSQLKIAPIVGPSPLSSRHPRRSASRAGEQPVEPVKYVWRRLQGHPHLCLQAVLVGLVTRRLDRLDILAGDDARRRPDTGVL